MIYSHLFQSVPGMWFGFLKRIHGHFPNLQYAWEKATIKEWQQIPGLSEEIISNIQEWRKKKFPEVETEFLEKQKIRLAVPESPEYPPLLKNIYDPPWLLYMKGLPLSPLTHGVNLAIVGSRIGSFYGEKIVTNLLEGFGSYRFTIVSGLAKGIDTLAHREALKNNLPTIAVLGTGIDCIYPWENRKFFAEMTENATLISEFPPGTQPLKRNFPMRNRIIAGMSHATLVVEAKEKSGALITAQFALQEGREVFAIPGDIYHPFSRGTNQLIQKGEAFPVLCAQDIIDHFSEMSLFQQKPKTFLSVSDDENSVLQHMHSRPMSLDALQQKIPLPFSHLSQVLSSLELKELIQNVGGGRYVRKKLATLK